MKRFLFLGTLFFAVLFLGAARGTAEGNLSATSEIVSFEQFEYPYFVKNTVVPPEESRALVLVLDCYEKFDEIFGVGWVMGTDPHTIKADYFKDHRVVSLIEWGNVSWEYTIRKIFKEDDQLTIKVSKTGAPSETAQFTPCLILGIPQSDLKGARKILFDFIPNDAPVTEVGEAISADL